LAGSLLLAVTAHGTHRYYATIARCIAGGSGAQVSLSFAARTNVLQPAFVGARNPAT
jgi:hypothetical protein